MRNESLHLLDSVRDWRAAGLRVFWVTVIETWGSAPRPPGAQMAVRGDGVIAGSVSGGCVEDDLVSWVQTQSQPLRTPIWRHYGVSDDDARRRGLACGGRLALIVEEVFDLDWVDVWGSALRAGDAVRRRVVFADGNVEILPIAGDAHQTPQFDTLKFEVDCGPEWRLLLTGAGALSRQVAQFAIALDYRVIVCDPRIEQGADWPLPTVVVTTQMPDDAVRDLIVDRRGALLALTHDPRLDDLALWEALRGPAFYIGALGSRTTAARRRERLRTLGVDDAALARLRGPAGLSLGGRSTAEIALSMVSELTAVRYGRLESLAVQPPRIASEVV